ncbi:BAR_ACAPs and ArfGap_ACAP domain-containing protein [Neolamprologus brichardi]|uniref:BAR_ACAPs and ArfGap_ACAP domain-containing protein n=1 Tax=Neolamprologus brichardi TaxID=32507 RepID=UPI0003EBB6D3|nr:BAR_ACAPs and ArfGap_ACAP domain-containing protein [Neolamprologus brichardi]
MDSLLDFEDCVKDSPEFRLALDQFETDVSQLETKLDKVMKLCGKMVEAGQAYSTANKLLLSGLAELCTNQTKDSVITTCLNQFHQGLQEMVSFHTLNTFKTQQKVDILNSMFSFVHAQFTFFHQGFDLLRDLEPTMKTMAAQLSQLSADCTAKRKELENRHLLVQQRDASGEPMVSACPGNDDIIRGYLFKRSRRKSKMWKRSWFTIRDNQLIYRKSHKEEAVVLFEDLRLCAVKSLDHVDRRFCFELLSVQKCCALQADSEQLKQAWLSALQGSIDLAYRERTDTQLTQPKELPPLHCGGDVSPGPPAQRPAALSVALSGPGNQRCCDCGEEEPRWASINLAVTMCIECSGIHRSLGVHLSKVRSLTLDSWEAEQLKLLCVLGNDVMNQIYEARCSEEGRLKPRADSPRAEKEAWIKEKYVEKKFVQANGAQHHRHKDSAMLRLYQASLAGDLVVCLLLKRGANQYAVDERGHDPLAIAVETANADIVTLLRMARMNEEMRDSEGAFGAAGDDETFQDIFRDFSDMASHDPERLSRRHFSRGGAEEEEEG